ncbi:MAG: Maf family protein [Planctomycetota bacterium]
MPSFLLASGSPRRRQLLAEAGYRFRVEVSDVVEPPSDDFPSAEAYVSHTAWLKAHAPAFTSSEWILAADTMAVVGDGCREHILGKPADRADAERILRSLAGTTHRVLTGVCLRLPTARLALVTCETSYVAMKLLSPKELGNYLDTGLWEGKAGAYGIQDHDDPFVSAVEGSYSNVMGLPMERLEELFRQAARVMGGEK